MTELTRLEKLQKSMFQALSYGNDPVQAARARRMYGAFVEKERGPLPPIRPNRAQRRRSA